MKNYLSILNYKLTLNKKRKQGFQNAIQDIKGIENLEANMIIIFCKKFLIIQHH